MSESVIQKDPPRTFKCSPGCYHPICINLPEKPQPVVEQAKEQSK